MRVSVPVGQQKTERRYVYLVPGHGEKKTYMVRLSPVLNGVALVEQIQKENPDIAIVDINMPGLDGLCALEMLRAEKVRISDKIFLPGIPQYSGALPGRISGGCADRK